MKIFCIGFHKTGTTSMAEALRILGYRVTGPNWTKRLDFLSHLDTLVTETVKKYDAFQDNPWPILYRTLDENYPGSKFILTLRDPTSWYRSLLRHKGRTSTPMREWIYNGHGCPHGNKRIYIDRIKQHNQEVLTYFEKRPKDLLLMNLAKGDGWDKLCPFLEHDIPSIPFPKVNTARDCANRAGRSSRILRRLRR